MGYTKKPKKSNILNNDLYNINQKKPNNLPNTQNFANELRSLIKKYGIVIGYNALGLTSFSSGDGSKMGAGYFLTHYLGCEPHELWKNFGIV